MFAAIKYTVMDAGLQSAISPFDGLPFSVHWESESAAVVRDGGRRLHVMQRALPQLHPRLHYPCDLIIHVHVLG